MPIGSSLDSKDRRWWNGGLEHRWDAGEIGCGQLVFELRRRIDELKSGDRLELIAHSPGAPTDLPAWCRMTGHTLISANPPVYVIQRKDD